MDIKEMITDNLTRLMLKRLCEDLRSGNMNSFSLNDVADEIEERFRLLDSDDENGSSREHSTNQIDPWAPQNCMTPRPWVSIKR